MKQFTLTLILSLFSIALMAQVPAGFSYQAVVRNNSGEVVANQILKWNGTPWAPTISNELPLPATGKWVLTIQINCISILGCKKTDE
jgi:hypothetical protein